MLLVKRFHQIHHSVLAALSINGLMSTYPLNGETLPGLPYLDLLLVTIITFHIYHVCHFLVSLGRFDMKAALGAFG